MSICAFNLVFAIGPGPISLFLTAELVGDNARGTASSYAYFVMGLALVFHLLFYQFSEKKAHIIFEKLIFVHFLVSFSHL